MGYIMKGVAKFFGLISVFVLPVGNAVEISTEYNHNVDFSKMRTFAWLDSQISFAEASDLQGAGQAEALIRSKVADSLAEKGYQQLPENQRPDFLVSYHVVVTQEEMSPAESPAVTTRINLEGRAEKSCERLRKGTVIVFVLDGQSHQLLWQGVGVETARSSSEAVKRSTSTVEKMLEEFPPTGSS